MEGNRGGLEASDPFYLFLMMNTAWVDQGMRISPKSVSNDGYMSLIVIL